MKRPNRLMRKSNPAQESETTMDARSARNGLNETKRLVIKVGSAVLANQETDVFSEIGKDIGTLMQEGREVTLVSSGAIAMGYPLLGYEQKPRDLPGLQAAAAMGQTHLMSRWNAALEKTGSQAAQILLTHADLANRKRYLNARHVLHRLLAEHTLPIVNENDTVSVDEIKVGDNDVLAAEICGLVSASTMILLTTADGFFTADPREDSTAKRIPVIDEFTNEMKSFVGQPSALGTGGMKTKLEAATLARKHGATTIIASGLEKNVISRILNGEDVGTLVLNSGEPPEKARKRWIAHTLRSQGVICVDQGAARALRKNASLLFAGVKDVRGEFYVGDAVTILESSTQKMLGKGLASMNHHDARLVIGLRTEEARQKMGTPIPDELIHRDDLVLSTDDEEM